MDTIKPCELPYLHFHSEAKPFDEGTCISISVTVDTRMGPFSHQSIIHERNPSKEELARYERNLMRMALRDIREFIRCECPHMTDYSDLVELELEMWAGDTYPPVWKSSL